MHSQVQPYETDQTSVYMPRMSARAHVIKFRKKLSKYTIFLTSIGHVRKSAILFLLFSLQTVWYHVIAGRNNNDNKKSIKTRRNHKSGIINLGSQCGERPCYRWTMSP